MSKVKIKTFSDLGRDYQLNLLNEIITDHKFAQTIIPIIEPTYFPTESYAKIVFLLKNYYQKHETLLNFTTLITEVNINIPDNESGNALKDQLLDTINTISNINGTNYNVQKTALDFCKLQRLKEAVTLVSSKLNKGDIGIYDEVENIIKGAITHVEEDEATELFNDLDSILKEDYRSPITTGLLELDELLDGGVSAGEVNLIIAPMGSGKAQPLSSKVLTPNGWTTMGEIKEGDEVISRDGKPTKVIGVFPQGIRPIYKVSFNDGTSALCDKEHLWATNGKNQRERRSWKNGLRFRPESDHSFKPRKTIDMIHNIKLKNGLNYKIPIVEPVCFTKKDLPINPYVLGVLLGDGCITTGCTTPNISTKDLDIIENIKQRSIKNITTGEYFSHTSNVNYKGETVDLDKSIYVIRLSGIKDDLKSLGLYGKYSFDKFIPNDYLYSSVEDRVELLQGLVDSDGYINKKTIEISTVSKELSNGIRELVLSLGGKVNISKKQGKYIKNMVTTETKEYYRIGFSFPNNGIVPALCKRKADKYKSRTKYSDNKFITSIEYSHEELAQCIMVDNPEHLYVTDDYIVTHNTSLLTKIASAAHMAGKNVLHIFMEDKVPAIRLKHFTAVLGLTRKEIIEDKEKVYELAEKIKDMPNKLHLLKLPAQGITVSRIRKEIKKINSKHPKIEVLIIDYVDCLDLERDSRTNDELVNDGRIFRAIELLTEDFNLCTWLATQGGRSSISSELVTIDQMGGTIKKAQYAHFIMSIAKTLQHKDTKTATVSILKNRNGPDGKVFENCLFDNERMLFDLSKKYDVEGFEVEANTPSVSINERKTIKTKEAQANAMDTYKKKKAEREKEIEEKMKQTESLQG
jgi:replicative DNA helicase